MDEIQNLSSLEKVVLAQDIIKTIATMNLVTTLSQQEGEKAIMILRSSTVCLLNTLSMLNEDLKKKWEVDYN